MSTDAAPPDSPVRRSFRSDLRAVLVALHVAAIALGAMPSPMGGLSRSNWKEPTVQAELTTWHGRLAAVGLADDRQQFEDDLYALAKAWVGAHVAVLKPFQVYYRYFGAEQNWRMFVAPHTSPSVLRIYTRATTADDWDLLYDHTSTEATWHAHQLRHTRMRSALFRYSWPTYKGAYRAFAKWVAREVHAEDPNVRYVKLEWLRRKTPPPDVLRTDGFPAGVSHQSYVLDIQRELK